MAAKNNAELMKKMETATAAQTNGNGTPKTVADTLEGYLSQNREKILQALPKHISADRISRLAVTTIRENPNLLNCTVPSLFSAILKCVQLGIEPGPLGHAYFVPFYKSVKDKSGQWSKVREVTFIIGYKGLLALARRSGQYKTIGAMPVYNNEVFEYEAGTNPRLRHVPCTFQTPGKLIGFYAIAGTVSGDFQVEFMNVKQVDAIRARSKAKDDGPWVTDYEQMGRKTVLRRLCNYLDLQVEVAAQIAETDDSEFNTEPKIEMNLGELPRVMDHPVESTKPQETKTPELSTGGSHQALTEADINAFRLGDNLPDTESDEYETPIGAAE